ncbi:MAG: MFS transporter [Sphingorhabdus sp.]|jgi:glycoside/pentoside/hexuronide:cation symporter, GPH family|uniref:MFS transporter n=1 Tax=Sphingorhabdus sp. TaxID=1902408 RepID=UPI00273D10F7|nr:MFS transporter [Sphingorhabdus sp.]MDP4757395.1 MFS transporter [Sphingorhabdus sp.]MDP4872693.1 MFS transporter [Sphingorhabdus sp.]MDP4927478.1 MFS transporter [Sphingorhabdus sp.]
MTPAVALPRSLKVMHGLGSVAYGVKDNGFSVFLLIFYNQVLGIDAGVVGTVIMAALIFDAFADPIIGELSDRTQSKWGRRLPWLYTAAIPLGIIWLLLWHPPEMGQTGTIIWLFCTAVLARSLVAMCEVPSIALVPELTADYDERTRLMRYRFLFGWAGGLLMLIFAYGIFFTGEKGVSDPVGYDAYSVWGALMMTGAVLISALGQHRHVAKQSPPAPRGVGLGHAFAEAKVTLSNRAFLWLVSAAVFGLINQGLTFALTNYQLGFLWQLQQMEMLYYALILFATVIVAFIIVPPLSARLGKKNAAILLALISMTFTAGLYGSWLLDLVPGAPNDPSILFMFALVAMTNSAAVGMMMLTSSMMADVVEASQQETGRRSEGLFFAGYFFMQKCAVGIGTFAAGMILTFADFPQNAVPGRVDVTVLDGLALYYMGTVLVLGIIGVLVLRHFPISRESHNERLRVLNTAAESAS